MAHKYFIASAVVLPLLAPQPVEATEVWNCTYAPVGQPGFAVTSTFTVDNSTLWTHLSHSSQRDEFEILQNSADGLMAVRHYTYPDLEGPDRQILIVVLLAKATGLFKFHGYIIQPAYEDVWQGRCQRAP